MPLKKEFSDLRLSFGPLTLYQKFEQVCVLMLTALIAIIIVLALWNLTLKLLLSILATNFDPTDYEVFQTVFGMIFTVIIALEFKRSPIIDSTLPPNGRNESAISFSFNGQVFQHNRREADIRRSSEVSKVPTKDQHHPPCHSSLATHRAMVPNMLRKLTTPSTSGPDRAGYCYIAGSGIARRSCGASGKLRQTVVPRPGVEVIVSAPA